jgi:hypothetical protein
LKEQQKCIITEFMEELVFLNSGTMMFAINDLYERFLDFCRRSHIPERTIYEKQKFGSALGFKNYDGVERKVIWLNGRTVRGWKFYFDVLKPQFDDSLYEHNEPNELMSDDEVL